MPKKINKNQSKNILSFFGQSEKKDGENCKYILFNLSDSLHHLKKNNFQYHKLTAQPENVSDENSRKKTDSDKIVKENCKFYILFIRRFI